jgi:hypothetical protein
MRRKIFGKRSLIRKTRSYRRFPKKTDRDILKKDILYLTGLFSDNFEQLENWF